VNFDVKAIVWDDEARIQRGKIITDQIVNSIDLKNHYRALDFGCGTGLISFNLRDELKDITCIDISEGMIDVVLSKIKQCEVANMIAYQQDINDGYPLVAKYDVIYTCMALHHIDDIEITLQNLYLLLNKGGYLCIVELDEDDGSFHKAEDDFKGHNGFNQEELKKILKKVGLVQVESHTFYHDEKKVAEVNVNYSLFVMSSKKI
jgi:ubiquinone/menaquinone biosynthesis C-methylase UbiE